MRVLMLHPQGSGVRYYRFQVPYEKLRKLGVDVELADNEAYQENFSEWLAKKSKEYDILHVGYHVDEAVIGLLLGARNYGTMPIITDIDDDIMNVPEYNIAYSSYHGGSTERRIARMQLRVSDAVTTSTKNLAAVLNADCKSTTVLPNCLQHADWPTGVFDQERSKDESVRFLFSGNLGRYGDLSEIREATEIAMDNWPQMRLFFLACAPDWALKWMSDKTTPRNNRAFYIPQCNVEQYRTIFKWIRPDVVFAPVQTNLFNKSKSHIKAYDAAMCGATFLCTDWDTYEDVPDDAAIKINNDTATWVDAIEELVENEQRRRDLSARLYQWATTEWHIDNHVQKWVNLYEKVHAAGPISELDQLVRPGVR